MQYFYMKYSSDPKIIGKFPQLEKMFDGYHTDFKHEAWGLSERRHVPMEKVAGFKLYYHAKAIDWIAAAHFSMDIGLFSKRFFELLQKFDCMESIAVESEVNHGKKTYPYKFVFFPKSYGHFVDFSRSRFSLYNSSSGWFEGIHFDNYNNFWDTLTELDKTNRLLFERGEGTKTRSIRFDELILDENRIDKDFFRLERISIFWVVSSRLKEAIESAGMTGMKFEPVKN